MEQKYIQLNGRMIPVQDEQIKTPHIQTSSPIEVPDLAEQIKQVLKTNPVNVNIDANSIKQIVNAETQNLRNELLSKPSKSEKQDKDVYSENETDTNKTWFNKKVYRKVIIINELPDHTNISIEHKTTFDKIVNYQLILFNEADGVFYTLENAKSLNDFYIDKKHIVIEANEDWSHYSGYCVIEYTKK